MSTRAADASAGADDGCGDRHIVLVGMMGAGKSSVGRVLARRLERRLLDSDEMIEAATGRTVREIWRDDGEAAFRALEAGQLGEALEDAEPAIVAAAGGVVLSAPNRDLLKGARAHVVWLSADVDLLVDRVRNGMHRPLLDDDPEATLRAMAESREPLYRDVADAIVSVDHRSVNDVAGAVLRCAG
ncbi:shikimate kinase [Ilumatobacter sp.]|uniref:shikimate kinase n=1 Tax=Ilumatobacter sp. TaxID=1967498 RepID=UPI003B525244